MSKNQYDNVVIGLRQILRGLKSGEIAEILLATDADEEYSAKILQAAKECGVKVVKSGTMSAIAERFGVEVATGAVGFLA